MFELSSILAIVFCGFFMRSYVEHNISKDSLITLNYLMKLLSNIMDITIFMFLGISAISEFWVHWNTAFVIWVLVVFFNPFFLSASKLKNQNGKDHRVH